MLCNVFLLSTPSFFQRTLKIIALIFVVYFLPCLQAGPAKQFHARGPIIIFYHDKAIHLGF